MKILVTGASGFVGYHLICRLLHQGYNVCATMRSYPKDERIKLWSRYPNFIKHSYIDLTNQYYCAGYFENRHYDVLIHLAGESWGGSNSPSITSSNILALHHLLQYCNFNKIIFASTISLYGNTLDADELYPADPLSLYAWSKYTCEQLIKTYTNYRDITYVNLRIGTIIGLGMTHGVLLDFMNKLRYQPRLEVLGDKPGSVKPFTHVDDIVSAFELSLKLQGTYNCCNNDNISIEGLIELLKPNKEVVWLGDKVNWRGDSKTMKINNSKLMRAGWQPLYNTSTKAILRTIGDHTYNLQQK